MLTFPLAISCLTTSNLPWFIDLTFQVPMQYCSLQHRTLLLSQSHHNWTLFLLWLHPFILSGVIYPLISSSIAGTYRPGEYIFPCPIFLPFRAVHETSILFSIVTAPIYIPTNSVGGFPFLRTISSIYYLWLFDDDLSDLLTCPINVGLLVGVMVLLEKR